jgi:mannose-6-phosphate isomerase-like protein (cupin superfamily)
MKAIDWKEIPEPLVTPTGEIIYELVGKAVTENHSKNHSLARIILPPGKSSITHYHQVSEETYFILTGSGQMQINDLRFTIREGQACHIKPGDIHRIENKGDLDLEFLAVCTPAWVPEDSFDV